MDNGPSIVLAEVEAIQEVHVNRRCDDPLRGQQLTQIQVSWRGILQWIMIAVSEYREGERAPAARYAGVAIERHVGVEKRPRCAASKISERRNVDPAGDVGGIRRSVDRILRQRRRVGEGRRAVDDGVELHFTGQSWVFQSCHFCSCHARSSVNSDACDSTVSETDVTYEAGLVSRSGPGVRRVSCMANGRLKVASEVVGSECYNDCA